MLVSWGQSNSGRVGHAQVSSYWVDSWFAFRPNRSLTRFFWSKEDVLDGKEDQIEKIISIGQSPQLSIKSYRQVPVVHSLSSALSSPFGNFPDHKQ